MSYDWVQMPPEFPEDEYALINTHIDIADFPQSASIGFQMNWKEQLCKILSMLLGISILSGCGGGSGVETAGMPILTQVSWEKVSLPVNLIESVAVSPLDRRVVYAGQRNTNRAFSGEHAVWRSDDGGESFKVVAPSVSFQLLPSPTDPDRVFGTAPEPGKYSDFSDYRALYLSPDRGQTWQKVFKPGEGILLSDNVPGHGLGQHPKQRDTIYASGALPNANSVSLKGGVFKSTDGGATWVDISPAGVPLDSISGIFAFDPFLPDTVFLTILSGGFNFPGDVARTLLRTVDGGKSWQAADDGLIVRSPYGINTHVMKEYVVTSTPGVLIGLSGFGQLWINSDGGSSAWRPLPLPSQVDHFYWTKEMPNTLVVANRDGTMSRSDDLGNTWVSVATPGNIVASALDGSDSQTILIITGNDEALYLSVNAGQTWIAQPKPPFSVRSYTSGAFRISASVSLPDHLIAMGVSGLSYGGLPRIGVLFGGKWKAPPGMEAFRSTIPVTSIAAFGKRLAATTYSSLFQQDLRNEWNETTTTTTESARIESDSNQRGIYGGSDPFCYHVGGCQSVFQSTSDAGDHWVLGKFPGYKEAVFDSANGRFWYVRAVTFTSFQIYRVDADGSINPASSGLPPGLLNSLTNSPQSPSRLYVGTPNGIYRSVDGGDSWIPAFATNSSLPVAAIAVDPTNALNIWTASSTGLQHSIDGGNQWVVIAPEIFASGVSVVAVHQTKPGVVVAGTATGIWNSIDAGITWKNVEGPTAGVTQILIVDDTINLATSSGIVACKSLCRLQ